MRVSPNLILCQEVLILLQLFLIPLQVLHHEVLASQLVVIGEMVDHLMVSQSDSCVDQSLPDFGLKRLRTVHTVAQ